MVKFALLVLFAMIFVVLAFLLPWLPAVVCVAAAFCLLLLSYRVLPPLN